MTDYATIRRQVALFQVPVPWKSLVQLLTSFGGFFAVCATMYVVADRSYWIALPLVPLAAGFLVRIFIIQHDCGHLSFFRSQWLNSATGFACSLITLAPYVSWARQHAGHHGVWNNLDRRQSGADIYSSFLTVAEYRALRPWARLWHRTVRHPLVANVVLPPLVFMVLYRLPFDMPKPWRRERIAVHATNLALVALCTVLGFALGFGRFAAVQAPVMVVASIFGVWLFSVQHRGESLRWFRREQWSALAAALEGTTYLRLSPILQWFTGHIGFHHIHHLNPSVPNYRLAECQRAISALHDVKTISIRDGFRALKFALWDEEKGRMVTFRDAV